MEYRGYTAEVEYDADRGILCGRVVDLDDVIAFEGASIDELRYAFRESVDEYLRWCEAEGREPERPSPGRVSLRLDSDLYRAANDAASREGTTLDRWLVDAVTRRLHEGPPQAGSPG